MHLTGVHRVIERVHIGRVQIDRALRHRLPLLHDDLHLLAIIREVVVVLDGRAVLLEGGRVGDDLAAA